MWGRKEGCLSCMYVCPCVYWFLIGTATRNTHFLISGNSIKIFLSILECIPNFIFNLKQQWHYTSFLCRCKKRTTCWKPFTNLTCELQVTEGILEELRMMGLRLAAIATIVPHLIRNKWGERHGPIILPRKAKFSIQTTTWTQSRVAEEVEYIVQTRPTLSKMMKNFTMDKLGRHEVHIPEQGNAPSDEMPTLRTYSTFSSKYFRAGQPLAEPLDFIKCLVNIYDSTNT